MIKTVKVKKELNLSELIAYISVSGIKDAKILSNYENLVSVDHSGQITTVGKFYNDTFTVEVEEEITEDSVFEDITVVCKINSRDETGHFYNSTLKDIKKAKNLLSAYVPIDGKLKLIWETE